MDKFMKAILKMDINMDKVGTHGQLMKHILAIFQLIRDKVQEYIIGQMEAITEVNGEEIE